MLTPQKGPFNSGVERDGGAAIGRPGASKHAARKDVQICRPAFVAQYRGIGRLLFRIAGLERA